MKSKSEIYPGTVNRRNGDGDAAVKNNPADILLTTCMTRPKIIKQWKKKGTEKMPWEQNSSLEQQETAFGGASKSHKIFTLCAIITYSTFYLRPNLTRALLS